MAIILDVNYSDKDRVKLLGAKWDPEYKTWYIPDKVKIAQFEEWLPGATIVKSPFQIIQNTKHCWRCAKEIEVIAINAYNIITRDYDDNDKPYWSIADFAATFSYVSYLPKHISDLICSSYPTFKYTYSKTLSGHYWSNTCKYCGSLQGDWFNHNEPDGVFLDLHKVHQKPIYKKITFPYDYPICAGHNFIEKPSRTEPTSITPCRANYHSDNANTIISSHQGTKKKRSKTLKTWQLFLLLMATLTLISMCKKLTA